MLSAHLFKNKIIFPTPKLAETAISGCAPFKTKGLGMHCPSP
jgi:hypothetical protein